MAVKTPPNQEWSIREKLCLASAVMRSGDQNWMSVSRAIKPFPEPGRPSDWNTPKNCAIQYSTMLSEVDTPKRKRTGDRGELVETPGDLIVKKMTFDRVEELKQMLADDRRKFKLLRDEIELIESGALDEKLPEILQDIREKKRQAEERKLAEEKQAAQLLAKYEELQKQSPVRKVHRPSDAEENDGERLPSMNAGQKTTDEMEQAASTTPKPSAVDTASTAQKTPVLLPKLLVSEKTVEKKETISKEQISDIAAMLSKPDEVQTPISQAETHTPGEKTPTLSKLLLTSGAYTTPAAGTTTVEAKSATKTKTPPSAKIPTVVEPESTEDVHVTVVEDPSSDSLASPQLLLPVVDNEDSSDVSMVASTAPSSPSVVKVEETKKRKRGRPRKKERDVGENTDPRPPSESADETKDGARSETAESEGTERPSESDRDSLSNVQISGSVFGESLPNSPASLSQLEEHQDQPYRQWKKAILMVWREAASHKYANLFLHPVSDDIAPGYSNTVYRRMDLSTIKKNIENGTIRTVEAFQRDMMLMFQNAIMYNRSDHDVFRMARDMETDVLQSIEEFISTQMLVRNPEASKSLRGRRNAEIPPKEEDKPKRPEVEHTSGKTKRKTRGDE